MAGMIIKGSDQLDAVSYGCHMETRHHHDDPSHLLPCSIMEATSDRRQKG